MAVIAFALLSEDHGGPAAEVAHLTPAANATPTATATPRPTPTPTPPTPTLQPTPQATPQPTPEATAQPTEEPSPIQEAPPPPTEEPPAPTEEPPPPTPEPAAPPTPPPPTPTPAPATSTVLGLPIIPGRTYVGSTSEGYPVAFWLSADGQNLEPYREGGELVTVSFLIQVSRPEGCSVGGVGSWPGYAAFEELPPAQKALDEALEALNDPATFTWSTGQEIAISSEAFQGPPNHNLLSGSMANSLASGQFGGTVKIGAEETCTVKPVTWSASLT